MIPSILAVLAHPDDEVFGCGGTLSRYASLGARVTVACATRGEAGKVTDEALGVVADVGALRELELQRACAALGVEPPVFLGYRDSGRLERFRKDDALALANADPLEVEARILDAIEETRPQVMLTFDPHGIYGHPDHVAIHRATTAAFFSSGSRVDRAPRRLFYSSMPVATMRQYQALIGRGPLFGLEPAQYGISEDSVAVRMDVMAFRPQKEAAIRAHRSQVGPSSSFGGAAAAEALELRYATETFSLGAVRGPVASWPLRGFFDGLEGFSLDA